MTQQSTTGNTSNSWLDKILNSANTLIPSFFGGGNQNTTPANQYPKQPSDTNWPLIVGIGVGVLALFGVGIVLLRK